MFPGTVVTVIFLALEYPRFGMLHAPHARSGTWNRCDRGARKGSEGLVKTCGYASVIKHGELGNPQPKWRFTAVRWEKKMGDSPLPGLTLGGYIWWDRFFHCWVADATAWCWTCTHFRAEVAKCQGLMPGDLWDKMNISIRVVALFFCRFAVQHRSIFLCNFGAFQPFKKMWMRAQGELG